MVYLMVKQTVPDFNRWKAVFDSMAVLRRSKGVLSGRVYRRADDPSAVTVQAQFASMEQAKAWATGPTLREAMQQAGISSPPEINVWEIST